MKRIVKASLALAVVALGGCVFAAGTGAGEGERIEKLERRITVAEKALNIQPEPAK